MFSPKVLFQSTGKTSHRLRWSVFLAVVVSIGLFMSASAACADEDFDYSAARFVTELEEAEVFIEWNSTDTDYGIQFFWDCEGFTRMMVRNKSKQKVLEVKTGDNVRAQGLAEGFFESVEPPASELSMEAFFERFPEGEYSFIGISTDNYWLLGEAEFTHTLPAPPQNLYPAENEVNPQGFTAGFDPVLQDTEGNDIDIEFYEVVVEKEEDEPILQTFTVILPPDRTSVYVPEQFLEPGTEYKLEVIAQEESGNRTITETGFMTY